MYNTGYCLELVDGAGQSEKAHNPGQACWAVRAFGPQFSMTEWLSLECG